MRAAIDPDQLDEPLFFDTLLAETLTPATVAVGDLQFTVEVPDGGQVGELDDAETDTDVLEVLLVPTDEDGADERDEALLDELLDALEHRPARELRNLVGALRTRFALTTAPPNGWWHLVDLLDRFGAGIEWDLLATAGGLRLHDFLLDPARHPWALLYRLLDYLPQGGGYWAAVQADEQWAQDQLDAEENARRRGEKVAKPSSRPALLGWTAQAERETTMIDTLRQGVHATWGASSKFKGKGGKAPGLLPRPRNAVSWVRRQRLLVEHDEFVGMLLPRGFEPPSDDTLAPAYRDDVHGGRPAPGERLPSPDAVRGGVLLGLDPD